MDIKVLIAREMDARSLTETQQRTFLDDNRNKPNGCSLELSPGADSIAWNLNWIQHAVYYKILLEGRIVGGIIVFPITGEHYELGRIWVDPDYQNQGIGQESMRSLFSFHSHVKKWTLGTTEWAVRNQRLYEALGFVRIGKTDLDPNLGWAGYEYERLA